MAGGTEAVQSTGAAGESPRLGFDEDAARKRAAVEAYARNETSLRRTARRFSLCEDDVDDALQRSFEILLCKAPTTDPRELIKWAQTVVKHEAMAIRSERERLLVSPPFPDGGAGAEDWVSLLPGSADGPPERAERREEMARSREALRALKPAELRALTLLAEGYSYAEIAEITSWSKTKVNRSLAEGRERFRRLISRSEEGRRCAELRPLISAFCDGEAGTAEASSVREHLRACAPCRAALRSYRAVPAAAAALAPVLPLQRSLLERAHEAISELAARFGGRGPGDAVGQIAGGGGGVGIAAAAKVAAVCLGTAGGAVACVAGGLVPAPLEAGGHSSPPRIERRVEQPRALERTIDYEPAAEPKSPQPKPAAQEQASEAAPASAEPAPEYSEPATSSGAVEYAPPPAPEPAPAESSGGNPAGEFGP
ncbi:MAG TPA: sigma-70 family RNA polymerase sigma factor [Solirubrobacterales bacterium]